MRTRHAIVTQLLASLAICAANPVAMAGQPSATSGASGEGTTAVGQSRIPTRFQGAWNVAAEHCGTGIEHTRLMIEANRIRFYESGGAVLAVVTRGESELAVIADMAGEGLHWLGLMQFRLSGDGACLTEVTAAHGPLVRCRCPSSLPTTRETTQEALP